MKHIFLSFITIIGILCAACSSSDEDIVERSSSFLLFENDKMACYQFPTKGAESETLIKLAEYPELEIYQYDNPSTKADNRPYDDVMYFLSGGENLLTVYSSFDFLDEGYIFHYFIEGWGENSIVIGGPQTKMSLGDFTLECMNDAYNNHGWASIFASVATAFCPYVMCGLFGGCVGHYLTERGWKK